MECKPNGLHIFMNEKKTKQKIAIYWGIDGLFFFTRFCLQSANCPFISQLIVLFAIEKKYVLRMRESCYIRFFSE